MKQEQHDWGYVLQIRTGGKQRAEGISTLYHKYAPQMKRFYAAREIKGTGRRFVAGCIQFTGGQSKK